jgi:hypothetical protein
MLIFVSGHHPILGTQMLYFLDPTLEVRAGLPPPTDLLALEEGEVVPQKAADKTRNVISQPEIENGQPEQSSDVQPGFAEELQLSSEEQEHAEESN